MRTAWRWFTFAAFGLMIPEAVAQSTSNSAMGSAGSSGGVPGGSAVAGAQGANSRGVADGGGPNLSPVIPSGSLTAPTGGAASQFNNNEGVFGAPNTTVGNLNGRPSTRQRFGNPATLRGADRGLVQPNRTYRSDIGAWQVIGPLQPGVDAAAYPANFIGNGGYTSTFTYGDVPSDSQSAAAMSGDANALNAVAPVVSSNARSNSLAADMSFNATQGNTALLSSAGVARPALGISMAAGFTGSGAEVSRIDRNGPAAMAGLRRGDVLTSVNGIGIYSYADVVAAMENVPVSGSIEIIAWRDGRCVPLIVHFPPVAGPSLQAAASFDPARTSAAESQAERLARIESLMSEVHAELQQLRDSEAGR